jgi:hypothetical protein
MDLLKIQSIPVRSKAQRKEMIQRGFGRKSEKAEGIAVKMKRNGTSCHH